MRKTVVTGKEIRREERLETFTVECCVASGVPRQVNRPETMPDIEDSAIINPSIRSERLKAKQGPAKILKDARDAGHSMIIWSPTVVGGVEAGSSNPSACCLCYGCGIEDVVEVTVRENDALDLEIMPAFAF